MPPAFEPSWRPIRTPPDLPPPGRAPQLVEPTAAALRWDAAVYRGSVPLRNPSVSSRGSGAASLPSMAPVSISSSADRRRELLLERHEELQAQLALVEEMLNRGMPSTMLSVISAASGKSAASHATAASAATAASGAASARSVGSRRSQASALAPVAESAQETGGGGGGASPRVLTPRSDRGSARGGSARGISVPRGGWNPGDASLRGTVPLCLDSRVASYSENSPFRSVVGTGLALPGSKLSAVQG